MLKLSFQQQVLAGFAATVIFGLILGVISFTTIKHLQNDADWVEHTQQVIYTTQRVKQLLLEAESGARGYTINRSSVYRESFQSATESLRPELQAFGALTSNDSAGKKQIDELMYIISSRLSRLKSIMATRDTSGFESAKNILISPEVLDERSRLMETINAVISARNTMLIQHRQQTEAASKLTIRIVIAGSLIVFGLLILLFTYIKRTFGRQKLIEERIRHTNGQLQKITAESEYRNWQLTGTSILNKAMRSEAELIPLVKNVITTLAKYLDAKIGALYLCDEAGTKLHLAAAYAFQPGKEEHRTFELGEGLIGQAAAEKQVLIYHDVPESYLKITSALGDTTPKTIVVQPVLFSDELRGVIELGFGVEPDGKTLEFIRRAVVSIGIAINTAQARIKMLELYRQTQSQAEELESQHEELMATNEELLNKTQLLQSSEEELQVQQEELRLINSELEEKAEQLEERNRAVEQAKEAISMKAVELENSSRYKSDFLANMSHELRTPLNSILILARILQQNKNGNLSDEQVKYAHVIQNAGSDLLDLINDILDLSKIEAGKIDLIFENIPLESIGESMEQLFREVARSKNIHFQTFVAEKIPDKLFSDRMRVEQVLKNLLSNAFKFTPADGTVRLEILQAEGKEIFTSNSLISAVAEQQPVIALRVIDTGIGIPENKQKIIFEAFHQGDGSTNRKYGGTGLGLSISRRLAEALGGEVHLTSIPESGSTFTLYLPLKSQAVQPDSEVQSPVKELIINNQNNPDKKNKTLLIIEDDVHFAHILKDYASGKGFTPLLAHGGDVGLEMAKKHQPVAIILDIMLPGIDGWEVLRKIKSDPEIQDIPVHLMSAGDDQDQQARLQGATGFLQKPVSKEMLDQAFQLLMPGDKQSLEKVLIIEDQEIQNNELRVQLLEKNVTVEQAFNGQEALTILTKQTDFDCIILDINLPDISGLDLLDQIKSQPVLADIPIVVNTAMELDSEKTERIMKHTHAMVLKSNKSNNRLLDEIDFFLNKIRKGGAKLPLAGRDIAVSSSVAAFEDILNGKSILIVDDDMRNVFALSSALESSGLHINIAVNGLEALARLEEKPDTDLVLMDIMMPEMDGYEAMREIRKQPRFERLPIIALTAKAMKNDREKSVAAGASDYISKPLDIDKLLSLIRVWLS